MTAKSFIFICVVGISSISIASAKSYYFTLTEATKAGTTVLKPGEYEVNVKGDKTSPVLVQISLDSCGVIF